MAKRSNPPQRVVPEGPIDDPLKPMDLQESMICLPSNDYQQQ